MAGCRQNEELIRELSVPKAGSRPLSFPAQYPTSMARQTQLLLGKMLISYWRNPQVGSRPRSCYSHSWSQRQHRA